MFNRTTSTKIFAASGLAFAPEGRPYGPEGQDAKFAKEN